MLPFCVAPLVAASSDPQLLGAWEGTLVELMGPTWLMDEKHDEW